MTPPLFFSIDYSPRQPKGWPGVVRTWIAPVAGSSIHLPVPGDNGSTVMRRVDVLRVEPRAYEVDTPPQAMQYAGDDGLLVEIETIHVGETREIRGAVVERVSEKGWIVGPFVKPPRIMVARDVVGELLKRSP